MVLVTKITSEKKAEGKAMTRTDIERLENQVVNEEQFEGIELSEDISAIWNCGNSSQVPNATLYEVELVGGGSINVIWKN